MIIDSKGTFHSHAYSETGDIAIVIQDVTTSGVEDILKWVKVQGFEDRLAGIFVVHTKLEKAKLKDLREGRVRVDREIEALVPQVKRILLMGDTKLLHVYFPVLKAGDGNADMDSCHGSLFPYGSRVLVPTWERSRLHHQMPWQQRDVARLLKLTRPAEPLPYMTSLPARLSGPCVIDLETEGLDATIHHITTVGLQWSDNDRVLITDKIDETVAWLTKQDIKPIMHNAQFDLGFMGPDFRSQFYGKITDTMIMARSRGELIAGLKHLGNAYTARPGNYAWLEYGTHGFNDPAYVCEDLDVTWRLNRLWSSELDKPVNQLMFRAVLMACEQSLNGSYIDPVALDSLAETGAALVKQLRAELTLEYGCDPGQTDLLTSELRKRGYPLSKQTKTGKDSLTAEVLEENNLLKILEFRKAMKLDSAFVGKLRNLQRPDGTLPHRQTILGAKTGRTTMTAFNWQQLPKKGPGKTLLVSRFKGGKIGNVDLKQAEVRVACWYALDQILAKALMSGDMHRENAARGFSKLAAAVTDEERFEAKALIFRSIFGGGPINDAQRRVHKYMTNEFHKLFAWIDKQKRTGQTEFQVIDALGKVTNMLDKLDYAGKWACGRLGINAPVQGTSSHVAIWLTVRCYELFKAMSLKSLVLFGVHDSITFDIHPEEVNSVIAAVQQAFRDLMDSIFAQLFPMMATLPMEGELQIGNSWADTKNGAVIMCSSLSSDEELPF